MKKIIALLLLSAFVMTSCSTAQKKDSNNTSGQKSTTEQQSAADKNNNAENKKQDNIKNIKADVGLTEGKMAPDFSLKNIEGKEVKLSDYRGRTVILNFFGVWCVWCTKEMPGFMKVYNEYKSKNIELLVVDNGDKLDTVTNYLKQNKFDIKPVMDYDSKVVRQYRVSGFPTSYIIDPDGIIKTVHSGYMDEGVLRNILSTLVK